MIFPHNFLARIVIATGLPEEKGLQTEVLDLINPSLVFKFLADIPSRWGGIGGLVQEKPIIGGGYATAIDKYYQDYFTIGHYDDKKSMLYERFVVITTTYLSSSVAVV